MGKLSYYVIHTSQTPDKMHVSKGMLQEWHMGPRKNKNGTITFMGESFESIDKLPEVLINLKPIAQLKGNGWDRLGYAKIIHRTGTTEILTPFNDDDIVDNKEKTWGASGINSISRHICLEGGLNKNSKDNEFLEVYTQAQYYTLYRDLHEIVKKHPSIIIIGHYSVSTKTCPNFNVQAFCKMIGIPNKNIGKRKIK